jgi:hypothetical protein
MTGRRCAKRDGNPRAKLLGAPVDAVVRHLRAKYREPKRLLGLTKLGVAHSAPRRCSHVSCCRRPAYARPGLVAPGSAWLACACPRSNCSRPCLLGGSRWPSRPRRVGRNLYARSGLRARRDACARYHDAKSGGDRRYRATVTTGVSGLVGQLATGTTEVASPEHLARGHHDTFGLRTTTLGTTERRR